jgi:hypothetical protein
MMLSDVMSVNAPHTPDNPLFPAPYDGTALTPENPSGQAQLKDKARPCHPPAFVFLPRPSDAVVKA